MVGLLKRLVHYFTEKGDWSLYYRTIEDCGECVFRDGVRCRRTEMRGLDFRGATKFYTESFIDRARKCSGYETEQGEVRNGVTLQIVVEPLE